MLRTHIDPRLLFLQQPDAPPLPHPVVDQIHTSPLLVPDSISPISLDSGVVNEDSGVGCVDDEDAVATIEGEGGVGNDGRA